MSSEIVSYALEYKNVIREIDALNNDIKKLRLRLKPRLNELQKEKEKYEKIILQYLERQQDPGFKYQDIVLYKEPKKTYPQRKERDEKLQEFLQQHNITEPEVVNQLKNMMKTKRIIDESLRGKDIQKLLTVIETIRKQKPLDPKQVLIGIEKWLNFKKPTDWATLPPSCPPYLFQGDESLAVPKKVGIQPPYGFPDAQRFNVWHEPLCVAKCPPSLPVQWVRLRSFV